MAVRERIGKMEDRDASIIRLHTRQLLTIRPCEPQPHVLQWFAVLSVENFDRQNVSRFTKIRWRKSSNE